MTTPTSNYAFPKPVVGASSSSWGSENNDCWDGVDAALKVVDDAQAATAAALVLAVPTACVMDFALAAAPSGWLELDASTIGDALSGSTHADDLTVRVLFIAIWPRTDLAILTSAGAASTRATGGGSDAVNALADFNAHKRLALPAQRGNFRRSFLSGTSGAIGAVQAQADLTHTHTVPAYAGGGGGSPGIPLFNDRSGAATAVTTSTAGSGSDLRPQNVAYLTCIKL